MLINQFLVSVLIFLTIKKDEIAANEQVKLEHVFEPNEEKLVGKFSKPLLMHEDVLCNNKPCDMSERLHVVCASDGNMYLNPGVMWCAQRCNKELKVVRFGDCEVPEEPGARRQFITNLKVGSNDRKNAAARGISNNGLKHFTTPNRTIKRIKDIKRRFRHTHPSARYRFLLTHTKMTE